MDSKIMRGNIFL